MPDDVQELQAALGRLRESVLFYIKLDVALGAGFVTLLTVFNVTPVDVVQFAPFLTGAIKYLVYLIGYGFCLEFLLTWMTDSHWMRNKYALIIMRCLYAIQVVGHLALIAYLGGYFSGSIAGFSEGFLQGCESTPCS